MSAVVVQQYKPDHAFFSFLALEMEAMFVIELIFLAIGLLLGCAMKKYKRSGSTAVGIILAAYFLSIITSIQANLDFLRYITPLKYFDAALLLKTGQLDVTFLLLSAGIIVACVASAYWVYNRRDLYI
jgi:ABC-2 type transport system permease protein